MSANPSDPSSPLAEITHGPTKFEQFLENNQKLLLLVAVLAVLGAVFYIVMRGVERGKEESAGASLIAAMNAEELEETIDEHSGTQAAKSAHLLLADNQWSTGDKDAAIATLTDFLADQPNHPAAPTAKASLASKWMVQGESDKAASLYQELVDDPEARYLGAYALICLGDIAAVSGDTDKAKTSYERVVAEFSDSEFVNTANSRIRDLGAKPPTVVAKPEPLEIKPEIPETDPETDAAEAALENEITLDPTNLPNSGNPLIPSEDKSTETQPESKE